ncbi:uncharacterized protein LOC128219732 [Mya arenaria]|uniref:uncharacterized protein LOC128219732 n=1 Tax=Mya arenaria TaxID=6604 RepID=UPI0022E3B657|nr:uncharacterized protein LOC128219732 [Mya arenaria]XP_052783646.1 uncharacterized protein LOC128219732 [Mya arenaria]
MGFKHLSVLVLLFVLLNPTECWFVKKALKKLGRNIRKGVRKLGKVARRVGGAIKKLGCKALFGLVCPAAVNAAGAALGAGSGGAGSLIVGAAVVVGKNACRVRKRKCKRSVEDGVEFLAFSDDFRDYDMNDDKRIEYEEFVFTIMRTVDLADPMELREPFNLADFNHDGELNTDEFNGAPLLFAHAYYHQFIKDEAPDNSTSLEVSTAA